MLTANCELPQVVRADFFKGDSTALRMCATWVLTFLGKTTGGTWALSLFVDVSMHILCEHWHSYAPTAVGHSMTYPCAHFWCPLCLQGITVRKVQAQKQSCVEDSEHRPLSDGIIGQPMIAAIK